MQNTHARVRRAIRVCGTVQGVGFRPMVYRVARAARLGGFVRNDSDGVFIEVEGDDDVLACFPDALRREAPPRARIDAIEVADVPARGDDEFRVALSTPSRGTRAAAPADTATCDACVRELFDPSDRRHRYPFVNCTDCGPRYTIIRDLPYDRERTTMDAFAMCERCRAEYDDPGDRRFHAEPIACPACGPQVVLVEGGVRVAARDEAIVRAAAVLRRGGILALKGLGGHQLAADARDEDAVRRLRARKRRPHKPFALMARDLAETARHAVVDAAAREALVSPARAIVLLPTVPSSRVAPSVAPGLREIGVMLPTTPLHHLLLADGPPLLVMTSGNAADEPIVTNDHQAFEKLGAIADAFLVHDRTIHTRADDSVVRIVAGSVQPVRRARGYAPEPIALGFDAPLVLAVGAEQKSTVCFTRGTEAFVSPHIGDLESVEARAAFEEVIEALGRLLDVVPEAVAHDLHPDYFSTRWALAQGSQPVPVQHHHAHVASCLAEHGRAGPAIGVAFDGTGCGPGGELWGGEVLLADLASFTRLGHLRPIALPGGAAAIREPWRLALAALVDAGEPTDAALDPRAGAVGRMVERGIATPHATGAGRWFDAIAALLGVRDRISYEAQAAIELEALAGESGDESPYPFSIDRPADAPFVVDLRPVVRAVAEGVRRAEPRSVAASRFYATMARIVVDACCAARSAHGVRLVALSGGCFQSALLTARAKRRLEAEGFEVLVHRRVPPNDGGISLGQAAVAAHRMSRLQRRTGGHHDVSRHPW